MPKWDYDLGSVEDFKDAPDWARVVITCGVDSGTYAVETTNSSTIQLIHNLKFSTTGREPYLDCKASIKHYFGNNWSIIAKRKPSAIQYDTLVSAKTPDNIDHPLRYTKGGVECIDAIKAATVGKTGIEAVDVANVMKYLWRYEEKNGLEDLKKAEWYIKHLIKELEKSA